MAAGEAMSTHACVKRLGRQLCAIGVPRRTDGGSSPRLVPRAFRLMFRLVKA